MIRLISTNDDHVEDLAANCWVSLKLMPHGDACLRVCILHTGQTITTQVIRRLVVNPDEPTFGIWYGSHSHSFMKFEYEEQDAKALSKMLKVMIKKIDNTDHRYNKSSSLSHTIKSNKKGVDPTTD